MNDMLQNRKTKRLGSADIAGVLRREIVGGALAAKDKLPAERILADQYGVARGTIREALNQIAAEGLVEVKPGSGTYVCQGQQDALELVNAVVAEARPLDLLDTRVALEPHICRLAVLHATPEDLNGAEEQIQIMERSVSDPITFAAADAAFHSILVTSTGNNVMQWIMSQISSVRNQEPGSQIRQITLDPPTIANYNQQHRQILTAIRNRDAERAAGLMKDHLESARRSVTRATST